MKTKFKKGDEVILIGSNDNAGEFYARRCVVDSWGKQQIHLFVPHAGQMLKRRLYADSVNQPAGTKIVAADADAQAVALQAAAEYIQRQHDDAAYRATLPTYNPNGLPADQIIAERTKHLHEPRFRWIGE